MLWALSVVFFFVTASNSHLSGAQGIMVPHSAFTGETYCALAPLPLHRAIRSRLKCSVFDGLAEPVADDEPTRFVHRIEGISFTASASGHVRSMPRRLVRTASRIAGHCMDSSASIRRANVPSHDSHSFHCAISPILALPLRPTSRHRRDARVDPAPATDSTRAKIPGTFRPLPPRRPDPRRAAPSADARPPRLEHSSKLTL
jgi:hypothetical protein